MRNLRRLKYGTALLVVSCIVGGFLALAATVLFAAQDIIFEMYPEFLFVEDILQVFITAGIMLMVVSALLIVGGIKSRFSRAWTIFLVVASSIITVLGFSEFDVLTLLLGAAVLTLSILNLIDANLRREEMRVLHSSETNNKQLIEEVPNSSTLEERLLELNDLKVRNVISETEYEELRKSAIEKLK